MFVLGECFGAYICSAVGLRVASAGVLYPLGEQFGVNSADSGVRRLITLKGLASGLGSRLLRLLGAVLSVAE